MLLSDGILFNLRVAFFYFFKNCGNAIESGYFKLDPFMGRFDFFQVDSGGISSVGFVIFKLYLGYI